MLSVSPLEENQECRHCKVCYSCPNLQKYVVTIFVEDVMSVEFCDWGGILLNLI